MHRTLAAVLVFFFIPFGQVTPAQADEVATANPTPTTAGTRTIVDAGPNRLLLAVGAASFAFAYAGAAWVGATSSRSSDRPLLVPFAGPWVALRMHVAAGCGEIQRSAARRRRTRR